MAYTDGKWEQGTPQPDLTLFLGNDDFVDYAAVSTIPAAPAAGLIYKTVPNSAASKFFTSCAGLFLRSGVYGTDQEQFGTAAGSSGPTTVANTGGPLGLTPGYPPVTAANMATVGGTVGGAGILRGPLPRGTQINSVDVVYQVLGLAATAATIGLTTTKFANLIAPVVTNLIALGTNGLPTAIGAQVQVTNVALASPVMITSLVDTQVVLNINLTAGATGTVQFYGAVLKCSYNLN